MRGITSIVVAMALTGFAIWSFVNGGSMSTAIIAGVTGLILLVRGCRGIGINSPDDVTAPMEFMSNPAGAIVDAIVDRVAEPAAPQQKGKPLWDAEEPKPTIDAEAIIARYLENRPAGTPAVETAQAPLRQFGRKGL